MDRSQGQGLVVSLYRAPECRSMRGGSWDRSNTGLWAGGLWKQDASGRLFYGLCLGNIAQTDVSEVVGNEELPAGFTLLLTVRLAPGPAHCFVLPCSH